MLLTSSALYSEAFSSGPRKVPSVQVAAQLCVALPDFLEMPGCRDISPVRPKSHLDFHSVLFFPKHNPETPAKLKHHPLRSRTEDPKSPEPSLYIQPLGLPCRDKSSLFLC